MDISGGDGSIWAINDLVTTSNALPLGGECEDATEGLGAGIDDAQLPSQSDAFDSSSMVWINGAQIGGDLTSSLNQVDFSSQTIGSFDVTMSIYISQVTATARILVELENITSIVDSADIEYTVNFGSDGNTTIESSSNGDTLLDSTDSWLITNDLGVGDPANTTVFSGNGNFPATVQTTSSIVFRCAGEEGVYANLQVDVLPGQTAYLLFFQQLNATSEDALNRVSDFNEAAIVATDLLDNLTPDQLENTVNWAFNDDDTDGDGVANADDICPATYMPEGAPGLNLRRNRFALTSNAITPATFTSTSRRVYTTEDTAGCSCEEILGMPGYGGLQQMEYGCTATTMIRWAREVQRLPQSFNPSTN